MSSLPRCRDRAEIAPRSRRGRTRSQGKREPHWVPLYGAAGSHDLGIRRAFARTRPTNRGEACSALYARSSRPRPLFSPPLTYTRTRAAPSAAWSSCYSTTATTAVAYPPLPRHRATAIIPQTLSLPLDRGCTHDAQRPGHSAAGIIRRSSAARLAPLPDAATYLIVITRISDAAQASALSPRRRATYSTSA